MSKRNPTREGMPTTLPSTQLLTQCRFNPLWRYFVSSKFKQTVAEIDKFVYRAIDQRKKDSEETLRAKTDIFSQFLLVKDEEGKPLTGMSEESLLYFFITKALDNADTYLRDVFLNFLLAGRDTTATLITWTIYELSKHPEIKEKVRDSPTPMPISNLIKTLTRS